MGSWVGRQESINLLSDSWWDDYAEHRHHATEMILEAVRRSPRGSRRVCVLGAGNGNDIHLDTVAGLADHLTLVDVDQAAVGRAVRRHHLAGRDNVTVEQRDLFDVTEASSTEDVVISAGLLTQLLDRLASSYDGIASTGAEMAARMLEVRDRHLTLMTTLSKPTGRRVLITDIVSSMTCPELLGGDVGPLEPLLRRCLATGNFFTGTNPFAVQTHLHSAGYRASDIQGPWLWRMDDTARLTCGIAW